MTQGIMAIVNPVSANGKTGKNWAEYEKHFREEGIELEVRFTQYPGHATELARKAVAEGYRKIMSVGGDGTTNEVINGLYRDGELLAEDIKLIIFSQGTGCDFIRSFGISKKIEDVVNIIRSEKIKKVDVCQASFKNHAGNSESRLFLNVADTGIGAVTAKLVNESSKIYGGFLSYLIGVFRALFTHKNKAIRVMIDGKEEYNQYLNSVIIANGKYFGGGVMIAPEAELDSGEFNIIILKDFSKFGIVFNLAKAYKGTHLNHPLVDSIKGREIYIELLDDGIYELELDGELVGRLPASFRILQDKLPIMA